MDGGDGGGFVSEVGRRKGPMLRRMLEVAAQQLRERKIARAALRAPKPVVEARVERSRLGASLEARLAVRAGVRLEDFLRHRLAQYAGTVAVPLEDLPVTIDIEGGEPTVRAKVTLAAPHASALYAPTLAAPAKAPDEGTRFARALVEREGPYAAREVREAESALDDLDARARIARERIEELSRKLEDDLASGALIAPPRVNATAEQLGRPSVPHPAPIAALRGFVAALLVAEAWRFSAPVLAVAGLEGTIDVSMNRAPVPALLALVFALGAAAAVFGFAGVALYRGMDLFGEAAEPRRRTILATASSGAALLAAGIAAAAAAQDRWAHLVLVVTVPFAAALLWRTAGRLAGDRAKALELALAWDRERAAEETKRGHRVEVVDRARAELDEIEADRAAARRRVKSLHQRAVSAENLAAEAARLEKRRLDRLAESLAAALELDRYVFVRLASERSREALVRPARAPRLEPPVTAERLGIAG